MLRILLVDDDPLRASARKSLLEGTAPDVVRAVDVAETLSLVVTDHDLKQVSGPAFVSELRARLPKVPVLVLDPGDGAENQYEGIDGVSYTGTRSPAELRALVSKLVEHREPQLA